MATAPGVGILFQDDHVGAMTFEIDAMEETSDGAANLGWTLDMAAQMYELGVLVSQCAHNDD